MSINLNAQENEVIQINNDDYLDLTIPPLSELFMNAREGAAVEYYKIRKEVQQSMVKTQEREWMRYFQGIAGYQYGVMGANNTFSDPNTPIFNQFSGAKQHWYNAGILISVPLDDIIDRGNKVKRQKLEMKATEAEVEKWYDEQKLRIIEVYSNALQFLAVLKAKSEAMILANAQYKMAETDFINGKLDAAGLSSRKSIQTDAIVDYEQTKAALNMSLLQLEVLSRTKILNK